MYVQLERGSSVNQSITDIYHNKLMTVMNMINITVIIIIHSQRYTSIVIITFHTVMIYITEKRCTFIVIILVHTKMIIIITVINIVHTVLIHTNNISQND